MSLCFVVYRVFLYSLIKLINYSCKWQNRHFCSILKMKKVKLSSRVVPWEQSSRVGSRALPTSFNQKGPLGGELDKRSFFYLTMSHFQSDFTLQEHQMAENILELWFLTQRIQFIPRQTSQAEMTGYKIHPRTKLL